MAACKITFAVVSAAGGTAFNHGFQMGLLNILSIALMEWYTDILEERDWDLEGFYKTEIMGPFMTACFSLGGITGSALIWVAVTFFGRKVTLLLCSGLVSFTLFFISFAYLAESFEIFIIGRVLLGISAGLGSGAAPMYLIEIAPECHRGLVGSVYYVILAASTALSYILSIPGVLGTERGWPIIFLICFVPASIQMFTLIFCPDTPKFYMFDRDDEEAADEALAWLQGDDVDEELEELREEALLLKEVGEVNLSRFFGDQTIRSPFIIALVILLGQQLSGINGIICFSTLIFMDMDYSISASINLTIGLGIVQLIAAVVSMFLFDIVGRKPLLLFSFTGMFLTSSLIMLVTILTSFEDKVPSEVGHIAVVLIYFHVMFYAAGAGPIPWFYAAEISNHNARASAMTMAVTINWFTHFLVVTTFVLFKMLTGTFIFMFYVIFDMLALIFIFFTMRETKDVLSVDIIELFYD